MDPLDERRREVVDWHAHQAPLYRAFVDHLQNFVTQALEDSSVDVHSVDGRVKTVDSLVAKSLSPGVAGGFKYDDPTSEITDVAGLRVTTYLAAATASVEASLARIFHPMIPETRATDLATPGYLSLHYVVQLSEMMLAVPGFQRFRDLWVEVQVRTILQHAWAEIQHDVLYKGGIGVPPDLKRRLVALAGLLELADREFSEVVHVLTSRRASESEPPITVAGQPGVTVADLRGELESRIGGAVDLPTELVEPLVAVVAEIGIASKEQLAHALSAAPVPVEALRTALTQRGYAPGPVEIGDALLRCALGYAYLEKRASFTAATAEEQAAARNALQVLMAAGA